jgi:hypothetical protein
MSLRDTNAQGDLTIRKTRKQLSSERGQLALLRTEHHPVTRASLNLAIDSTATGKRGTPKIPKPTAVHEQDKNTLENDRNGLRSWFRWCREEETPGNHSRQSSCNDQERSAAKASALR